MYRLLYISFSLRNISNNHQWLRLPVSSTQPVGLAHGSAADYQEHRVLLNRKSYCCKLLSALHRLLFIFVSPYPVFYQYVLNRGDTLFQELRFEQTVDYGEFQTEGLSFELIACKLN